MIGDFIQQLLHNGLEYFGVYYGVYRATVTNNRDPEMRGRVKATVHELAQTKPGQDWFDPMFHGGGNKRGEFWPPEVGDTVQVCFDGGNPARPKTYWGGWHAKTEVHPDLAPDPGTKIPYKRGWVTRLGHQLTFNDQPGQETVKLVFHASDAGDPALGTTGKGSSTSADTSQGTSAFVAMSNAGVLIANQAGSLIELATSGTLTIVNSNGSFMTIHPGGINIVDQGGSFIAMQGNTLTIGATQSLTITAPSGVTIDAVGINVGPLGTELLQWLRTHRHPTGVGPSGPPIVPL